MVYLVLFRYDNPKREIFSRIQKGEIVISKLFLNDTKWRTTVDKNRNTVWLRKPHTQ